MSSERSRNPFVLVLLVVGLLAALSLLPAGLTLGGTALRPVRLLADVLRKQPAAAVAATATDLPPPNGPAAPVDTTAAMVAPPDSSELAAHAQAPAVPNLGGLDSFLAALRRTKADGSKVRIAYFGDSMIEGDLITGDLRNSLQQAFGGTGVGYVPIGSVAADFRGTVHETNSGNWLSYDLVSPKLPGQYPLGLSGHVFVAGARPADSTGAAGGQWVSYRAGGPWAPLRRFEQARLFYGPGPATDVVRVTANNRTVPHELPGTAAANELTLTPSPAARQMRFDFDVRAPRPVYGVSFESPGGVTLDNFSFRGNSGMSLTRIPFKELAAFGKLQAYDLIILHYGVNVASARNLSYGWYERAMTRVVDRLQRACPAASILIVGMSDKSSRIDGEFVTDLSVPRLLKAQRRLAERNHAAFWNLFEAMGGENSMVSWVEESPALANRDYTHVNSRGARKIARLLFDYLMAEYAHPGAPAPAPTVPAAAPDSPAPKPAPAADTAAAVMR
ncbi:SGNH/GDSL hydrolase family protein [Hymenobacter polaris]|uniref:hypothetical protein n=1 Tax=Hymenobacter polaris TaxID=2682546 RepID=UPI0018A2769B|nr:hypothetical protein [Hymenobacter polaris]